MPTPTRPVADAAIATDWGQQVHDYTFAPAGVECHGAATVEMAAAGAYTRLALDTVDDDPGGYLDAANDQIEIPTDGAGYYFLSATYLSDNGDDTDETRVHLMINGEFSVKSQIVNNNTVAVYDTLNWMGLLAEGDLLYFQALQVGSDARADVRVTRCSLLRLGNELGAA